jgi:protein-tyrosine phosphatase
MSLIDFHNHLMPGVDDGARNLQDTRRALRAFREAGITGAVATPHLNASLVHDPRTFAARMAELDTGWAELQAAAAAEDFGVWRGAEVALDIPGPDLSDARMRLAGTRFVLVEFAYMTVPPNSARLLAGIRDAGWLPILAHPERYAQVRHRPGMIGAWREAGAYLQVNGGSLIGRYGPDARAVAHRLLTDGLADYISSDYHARGLVGTPDYRHVIEVRGGQEQASLLLEVNPQRMLHEELPLPIPPLPKPGGLWRRMRRLFR